MNAKREAKFIKIANLISDSILNKTYTTGERLPSVRELCDKFNCSHMTAVNVYIELERRDLIETRPRSGHYVKDNQNSKTPLEKLNKSKENLENLSYSNLLAHLLETESAPQILPLGTAVRLESYLPLKKVINSVSLRQSSFMNLNGKYAYPPGEEGLRTEIAKRLQLRENNVSAADIVTTFGATEALFLSLKLLTRPGDKVIVQVPCFFGTHNIINQLDLKIIEVHEKDNKINIKRIQSLLKKNPDIKAGIFQVNYNNPTGLVLSNEEKRKLFNLFSQYSIPLVEDDTYGELSHQGKSLTNLKSYDLNNELVFSCSSFSKTIGPGFRVGWAVVPKKYFNEYKRLKLATTFSGVIIHEKMIENFLKDGHHYDRHLKKLNKSFEQNIEQIASYIDTHLRGIVSIHKPKGGFCLWLQLPKKVDSFELYRELIKKDVAVSPGHIFSSNKTYKNYIRINCGISPDKKVEKAIILIKSQLELMI